MDEGRTSGRVGVVVTVLNVRDDPVLRAVRGFREAAVSDSVYSVAVSRIVTAIEDGCWGFGPVCGIHGVFRFIKNDISQSIVFRPGTVAGVDHEDLAVAFENGGPLVDP